MLNRRLQVLVDEETHDRLRAESASSGAPIGELVRRAIHEQYPLRDARRPEAFRSLLDAPEPPGEGPEPDWEVQKQELRDRDLPGA